MLLASVIDIVALDNSSPDESNADMCTSSVPRLCAKFQVVEDVNVSVAVLATNSSLIDWRKFARVIIFATHHWHILTLSVRLAVFTLGLEHVSPILSPHSWKNILGCTVSIPVILPDAVVILCKTDPCSA